MDKLDRLVWAAGIAFRMFGARVGASVSSQQMLDQLIPYLPDGRQTLAVPRVDRLYSLATGKNSRLKK
jgi:hypothetical protein